MAKYGNSFVCERTVGLEECISDVLTVTVPLILPVVTSSCDDTIPHTRVNLKVLVPSSKIFLEWKRC